MSVVRNSQYWNCKEKLLLFEKLNQTIVLKTKKMTTKIFRPKGAVKNLPDDNLTQRETRTFDARGAGGHRGEPSRAAPTLRLRLKLMAGKQEHEVKPRRRKREGKNIQNRTGPHPQGIIF